MKSNHPSLVAKYPSYEREFRFEIYSNLYIALKPVTWIWP